MKSFLFEKYGYYPNEIQEDSTFIYKNWIFKLENAEDYEEKQLMDLATFSLELTNLFNGKSGHLIRNRSGTYKSNTVNQSVCLVAVPEGKVTFEDMVNLHQHYMNHMNQTFHISDLITLWEARYEFMERTCLSSIRMDDDSYREVLISTNLTFGMAENALQYLADAKLAYGDDIKNLTLTHKRLSRLDTWHFFNPFNFIIDNALRDLAELFKADSVTTDELMVLLKRYPFTQQEASIFMARILFPTSFFDLLENHYAKKVDIRKDSMIYHHNMERLISKLKNIHLILIRMYQIRPIDWLIGQK